MLQNITIINSDETNMYYSALCCTYQLNNYEIYYKTKCSIIRFADIHVFIAILNILLFFLFPINTCDTCLSLCVPLYN